MPNWTCEISEFLKRAASERRLVNYLELGTEVGPHSKGICRQMDYIQRWCLDRGLTPVNMLVACKEDSRPSSHIDWPLGWNTSNWPAMVEAIYANGSDGVDLDPQQGTH